MVEVADRPGFVGRSAELAMLDAALVRAETGRSAAVVVGGEAGIGKTRLIEAFRERAIARGAVVLEGACLGTDGAGLPYGPFVEALRTFVRRSDPARLPALLGPARHELARLLPELEPRSGPSATLADLDRSAQSRLFELVLGVVERLGRSSPVVVVVEDLHWADEATRDILGFLVRNLRDAPVLFVVSARSDELGRDHPVLPFLAELERGESVERIELRSFDRDELEAQLAGILGRDPAPELVEAVLARTDGNPFFAEQLVEATAERAWTSPSADSGSAALDAALPRQLHDVLVSRIGGLSGPAQDVLRAASAAGRRTDDALLAAVLGMPDRDVAAALREIIGRGILVSAHPQAGGEGGYAFRHSLLREVVYSELLPGERLRIHAGFARALRDRGEIGGVPVGPGDLAYHWDASREYREALPALIEAGRAAELVYAFGEARRCYERALELWERAPGASEAADVDHVWLLERAAEVNVLVGSYDRAIELGREAIAAESGRLDPDPARLGHLHERLRWFLWEAGDRRAAAEAVQEAVRLIPADPPTPARARALGHLAGIELGAGNYREALEAAREALEIGRAVGAPAEQALGLGVLGWAQAILGDVEGGIATFRRGLAIAVELGGVEGIALGHAELARLYDAVGRTEDSLAAAREGFEIVRRLGLERTYGGILLGHAAKALIDSGRWGEAAAVLDEGLDRGPSGPPAIWLRVQQARLDANRGRFGAAAEHLRSARAADDALGGTRYRGALLAGAAELGHWQGRLSDVRAAVDEGWRLDRDDGQPDPALGWLAAVALRAEADAAERARARRDEAAVGEARARATAIAERLARFEAARAGRGVGDAAPTGRVMALAALYRAELGRLEGARDPAAWGGVAAAWEAIGRPYPTAYARFREAEAHLARKGPREAAETALRAAHEAAARLDAEPLRREIELLARQARLDLGSQPGHAEVDESAPSPTAGLGFTAREEEVLRLVAGGWSNQQIADALFISRKTASVHVSNILGKLGVPTRVEAAAIAHRLGLAEDAPPPPGREP